MNAIRLKAQHRNSRIMKLKKKYVFFFDTVEHYNRPKRILIILALDNR